MNVKKRCHPFTRAVQFSVESTFRGGLHVVNMSHSAQMEATSESGLHHTFRELNNPALLQLFYINMMKKGADTGGKGVSSKYKLP